jgi:hypothetical protein
VRAVKTEKLARKVLVLHRNGGDPGTPPSIWLRQHAALPNGKGAIASQHDPAGMTAIMAAAGSYVVANTLSAPMLC